MSNSTPPAKSFTHPYAAADADASPHGQPEDDFALGFESANPALQIELWGREDSAQALQQFH